MNNEFEWRSGMRKLQQDVAPEADLWPSISARLDRQHSRQAARPGWQRRLVAIAATLVIASGAGLIAYRHARDLSGTPGGTLASTPSTTQAPAARAAEPVSGGARTAFDWAVPADPKLASAAHDLDKASVDLQAALEAHPDAVFLVSMINRTNAQRMRLMRQSAISG